MAFTENWFNRASGDRLVHLARSVADVPGLVIEIGSWEGRSSVLLANAVAPRVVHCVDTWRGSPSDESGRLAEQRDVHATFLDNIAEMTAGNVVAHRMGWREFLPTVSGPVALCFIDAEHTYDEVFDNIVAVLALLAPGGVICGDDWPHPPVLQAARAALPGEPELVGRVWSWHS